MDRFIFFATFTYEVGLNRIGSAQVGGVYRCSVPYKKVEDMTDAELEMGHRGSGLHVRMRITGSWPAPRRRARGRRQTHNEDGKDYS